VQHVQDDLRPVLAAERLLATLADATSVQDHDGATASPLQSPAGRLDIERVVQRLGIRIAKLSPALRPGVLGYLEPGENLIFLRVNLPRPVWRFTLAHEIGHAALHRAWGLAAALARGEPLTTGVSSTPTRFDRSLEIGECAGGDFAAPLEIANGQDELLSPGQAYSAAARREQEANLFAAALLLPADALLRAYFALAGAKTGGNAETRPSGAIAQELARRFGVSEDVALRRLTALLASLPGERRAHRDALATGAGHGVANIPSFAPAPTLDRAQRLAAEAKTPALVIAGPGAGKTSALLGRILYLIAERNVAPSSILALTFSNKAARELQTRLLSALADREERLGESPENFPTVNTIHGFCGEVLRRYGDLVGVRANYRLVSEVEGYFLLRQIARDLPLTHYHPLAAPTQYYPDLLAAISRAKDELADPARYHAAAQKMLAEANTPDTRVAAERAHEVALVYDAYQRALEARGDPDFGDIIRLTVRLLQEHQDALEALRAQYDAVLVDEFQDINYAMAVLLRLLAGAAGPLWAVGDADQAIYRFRGAAPDTLARFADDYPTANVLTLPYNYRSLPPILEAASAVANAFLATPQPRANDDRLLIPTRAQPQPADQQRAVTLASAPDEAAELAGLTEDIRMRIAAGRSPGEIAILCRTHRQAAQVVAALRHGAIPTLSPAPLFDQPIVKDLLATLSLLVDPSGAGLLRAGALPDHAFTRAEAVALLQAARRRRSAPLALLRSRTQLRSLDNISPDGIRGFERLRAILAALRRAPNVMAGLARYAFSMTSLGARLLDEVAQGAEQDARRTQDQAARQTIKAARQRAACLERLLALAHAYDEQRLAEAQVNNLPAPTKADWAGFLDFIRTLITLRQRLGASDDALDEEPVEAVRVLTVHESKGLEFPVVYLPGLVNRRFPSALQHERAPAPSGLRANPANLVNAPEEAREATHMLEEACLFYVALTRARDTLVLSYARRYGRAVYHPSPFLAPIEQRLGGQLACATWRAHVHESSAHPDLEKTPDDGAMLLARRQEGQRNQESGEDEDQGSDTHTEAEPEAVSIAALESALRCPRQYAYRTLYGFGERQAGLSALRRGVQETLSGLHSRFAASRGDESQEPSSSAARWQDTGEPAANGNGGASRQEVSDMSVASARKQLAATRTIPTPESHTPPTLDEARSLFDHHWALALNSAHNHTEPNGATPTTGAEQTGTPGADATHAIYQRHGRQIAERLWRDAMQQHGLWDTFPSAENDQWGSNTPATGLRPGAARAISVQVHGRAITGVLDHVEETPAIPDTPIRVAYYRTSGDDEPTLHDLFYTLAVRRLSADLAREGRPAQVEAIRYSLATGEAQPIILSPRQRERLERALDEAFATLDRGVFPAKPDARRCQHCPFLLICPA